MSKQTKKYKLGYFEAGDHTSATTELQRWETIDAQLYSVFSLMGNGVISGWNIIANDGLSIDITSGSGHVNFLSVKSSISKTISNLTPLKRNYIYAQIKSNSYWTRDVEFQAYVTVQNYDNLLLIGYVDTDISSVTDINTDDKEELGYIGLIKDYIKAHRHTGGTDSPPPINLASEVQGIINQNNLPELDASIITKGTLDPKVLPELSHKDNLTDTGTLSHAQIDSAIESLSTTKDGLLGEVAIGNLLQLVLALKHVYPNIDDYLVNNISIIPGITPDDYIDLINSTATIDLRTYAEGGEHTITGPAAAGNALFTKIWDEENDYLDSELSETILDGNAVTLDTYELQLPIDTFSAGINGWEISTQDSSNLTALMTSDSTNYVSSAKSAKVSISGNEIELVLLVEKEISPQDWSDYKYLTLQLKTTSLQHGDLFLYIKDSVTGIQNSYTNILSRNKPTINAETLENGWEEVTIDISSYTRTSIDAIGFLMSTQDGWNTSYSFEFNVDDIKLTSGNVFKDNGYIRLKYENNIPSLFNAVRWNAIIPSGSDVKYRVRTANTELALNDAIWSDYFNDSGETIGFDSDELFKNIEIELYLSASSNLLFSPYIQKVFLDFYITDEENSIDITSQDDWEKGDGFNVDTTSSPGDLKVNDLSSIGSSFYGTDGSISQLNSSFEEDWKLTSTSLPITTHQKLNGLHSSLGLITAIDKGENGNIWLADIDNDRILEITQAGNLVRGLYGSFLTEPEDKYEEEENGPGSNIYKSTTYETEFDNPTTTTNPDYALDILHSLYNPETGILYVVFNKDIENIYSSDSVFDLNKFYLKVGTHIFYLYNSTYEIVNVPESQYDEWIAFYNSAESVRKTYAKHMRQFKFSGHVVKLTLSNSEKISLNKLVRVENPFITMSSPCNKKRVANPPTLNFITKNFDIGTSVSEAYIKVTLDGLTVYNIFENTLNLPNLSIGSHEILVELIDSDGNEITDIGASFTTSFVVTNVTTSPLLEIVSPKPNQIFSSNVVNIDFNVENFPILEEGQHIKYKINGEVAGDHYSTESLAISDLDYGLNTLTFFLVDENGNDLNYSYGEISVDVIVGSNQNSLTNLYFKKDGIQSFDKSSLLPAGKINVDVGNVNFVNMFSPIDLQIIKDSPSLNSANFPTILVAKLRSPSGLSGLSGTSNSTEMKNRIINGSTTVASEKVALNSSLSSIESENLIFNDLFLDGHSVVEYDMDGNLIASNNAARFSNVKSNAKNWLGSAKKISSNEFLIADAINKRAIIAYIDFENKKTELLWEYSSDRYISDSVMANQNSIVINIYDGSIDLSKLSIVPGTNVTWKNLSASPITIYSGKTTEAQFNEDPTLANYGDEFQSELLNNGETYTFRFDTEGSYDWFSYSSILTGNINVAKQRLSPNDQFYIIENDGLDSPFTSRVIKIDSWGNVIWSFGEGYIVSPRDVRVMSNGKLLIST